MRFSSLKVTLIALSMVVPTMASARTLEPGAVLLSASLGPGIRLGSTLGGSGGYFVAAAQAEYAFEKSLSAVADVSIGLAGTIPLRFHAGARYRLSDLDLPISPYVQAQLSAGRLYNVLGANLPYYGVRLAGGGDYFLTGNLGAGALVGVDLGSTTGERPAFHGIVDVLVYATYSF